jgi:hypothetical protein
MISLESSDEICPHFLFNIINQCKPVVFLDIRPVEEFVSLRIRNSRNASACFSEIDLNSLLTRIYMQNSLHLVCVFNDSVGLDVISDLLSEFKKCLKMAKQDDSREFKNVWTQVRAVNYTKFEDFYGLYSRCPSIFEGARIPPLRKGLIKYYPTEIIPGVLYLGDYRDGTDDVCLNALGITHIVDATGDSNSMHTADRLGIQYLSVEIWDLAGVDIAAHFSSVFNFIELARGAGKSSRILVHCRAGISRSSTFVLAYLLQKRLVDSLSAAFRLVLEQRPILPNASFRQQLREFELALLGTRSFADDDENMRLLGELSHSWNGFFNIESDHDRLPIMAGRMGAAQQQDELSPVCLGDAGAQKPKKAFLKRGQGKRVA